MIKKLLYLILFLPFTLSAQTGEMITQVEQKKNALAAEVNELQDSIQNIDKKLAKLKKEQEEQKPQTVEVQPEIPQFKVNRNAVLMSRPNNKGKAVIEVGKGSLVQIIDKVGVFYLVCTKGNCGYLPRAVFTAKEAENKK